MIGYQQSGWNNIYPHHWVVDRGYAWRVLGIIAIALFAITLIFIGTTSATYPIAVASSVEGPGLEADKAIDGDLTTRWSSNWTDNEWIYIDFGRPKLFNTITLNWETAYANSYQIQVSDDAANWTTVYSTTSGDGGIDTIYVGNQSARFVKMLGIKRTTNWGYSLWEFTVSFKPTNVIIEGRQILVNGKPFTIKGVGYASTPICANPGDYFTYDYRSIYARDLPLLRAMNCNAIRLWGWDSTSNHSDFLDEAYNNDIGPIYVIAGYWIEPSRNLSDPNVREDIKNEFKNMVVIHKDHKAILMWCVCNELNLDWLNVNLSAWYSLLNECAQIAHDVEGENFHPVTTANWDIYDISDYEAVVKDMDAWGANVYRGSSFGDLFTEYANISTKPFWISEYGIDAFDNRYDDEYEKIGLPYQAIYAGKLWDEMEASSVCSGGTIMAYSDEWWKAGDPCTHDNGGYPISAHPDGYSNEEWWGIMRTVDNGSGPDIMQPREVYYTLKNKWGTGVNYVLDDFDDRKQDLNDFFGLRGIWTSDGGKVNATFDNTIYYGDNGSSLKLTYDVSGSGSSGGYWEHFTYNITDPDNPIYDMSEFDELRFKVKGDNSAGYTDRFYIEFVEDKKRGEDELHEISGITDEWLEIIVNLSTMTKLNWTGMRQVAIVLKNSHVTKYTGTLYFDDLVFVDYDVNITTDDQFLDLISKRTFKYFWDTAHPTTGLMRDRATNRELCSIASVGFGLTTYCIAAERGWVSRSNAAERVEKVLNTLWDGPQGNETANVTGYNGFFYHFLDMETGYRYEPWIPSCELSSIDTALLLAGVLTCKEYFDGSDTTEDNIRNLSDNIYRRVNWTWMLNGGDTLSMGWRPETGFLPYRWEGYNEAMILYLLAIGSPNQNHSLPNSSWDAWAKTYKWGCGDGEDFIYCPTGSLFTYQYSHCWIDFRNKHDAHADYWQNSINAVKENRQFCIDNSDIYPTYGENCWGLTACDCPNGYCGYGSCPAYYHDGIIAPTGAGGSVALVPDLAIPALRFMYTEYGDKLWGVYGFRDAFNLDTDLSKPGNQEWWDKDYIGIDEGAVIVMIENFRSGLVWNEFMQNPYIIKAMDDGGFVLTSFDTGHGTYPSIFGSHNGTIKPLLNINVTRMYTYPCAGTGRHCEYVKFWNSTWNVSATLKGYAGDWHNITFDVPFVFEQGKIYNYTIRTGFYPQIHHTDRLKIDDGVITCISFVDANGKKYDNCIPAIGLE